MLARRPARLTSWLTPFGVLSAVALLAAILIAVQRPWVADFWLHAATVDRLRADLVSPGNPVVEAETGSPYYTPYTVLLALLARITGLSAIDALTLWGPVNVALLLAGVRLFARRLGGSPWLPVALLLSMLLVWGPAALGWSGFMTLFGLPLVMSYPSTFAFALTLILWALLLGAPGRPGWGWGAGVAALASVIVLSHPFTAVLAAIGAAGILVATFSMRLVAVVAPPALAGVAVMLVWPYYTPGDLAGSMAILDGEHAMLYQDWRALFGYPLITPPLLALRCWRDKRDPLVWMFLLGAVPVAYGALTQHWAWARIIPLVAFAGQAALAAAIADFFSPGRFAARGGPHGRGWAVRIEAVGILAGLVLVCLRVQGGNLLHVAPLDAWPGKIVSMGRPTPKQPDYSWVASHAKRGDIIATTDRTALRTIAAYGLQIVAPTWPDPLLADEAQRRADQEPIVAPDTDSVARQQLLARYRVGWLMLGAGDTVPADLRACPSVPGPGGRLLIRACRR